MKRFKKFAAMVTAAAMSMAVLPAAEAEKSYDEGLVFYYDFENEATYPSMITDKSGNGNHADVINNSTRLTVEDGVAVFPPHSVYSLASTLRLPNDVNTDITDFTYAAWVKATALNDGNGIRLFDFGNMEYVEEDKYHTSYNSIFLRYSYSSGTILFQDRRIASVNAGGASDERSFIRTTLEDCPISGKWCHVALTYEKEGVYYTPRLYINGSLVEEFSSPYARFTRGLKDLGTLNNSTNGMFIGRTVWYSNVLSYNPDFIGSMDEIRLYDRVLSADEIYELCQDTIHSNPAYSEIVLHYLNGDEEIREPLTLRPKQGEVLSPAGTYGNLGSLYTLVSVTDSEGNIVDTVTVGEGRQEF